MSEVYITEMLRWGDTESHHYIVGAFTTEDKAELAGKVEREWRGGKYEYRVICQKVDEYIDEDAVRYYSGFSYKEKEKELD